MALYFAAACFAVAGVIAMVEGFRNGPGAAPVALLGLGLVGLSVVVASLA